MAKKLLISVLAILIAGCFALGILGAVGVFNNDNTTPVSDANGNTSATDDQSSNGGNGNNSSNDNNTNGGNTNTGSGSGSTNGGNTNTGSGSGSTNGGNTNTGSGSTNGGNTNTGSGSTNGGNTNSGNTGTGSGSTNSGNTGTGSGSGSNSGHTHANLSYHPEQPATCLASGMRAYYYCSCGAKFEDESGVTEISNSSLFIPQSTEHSYNEDDVCIWCGTHKPTEDVEYSVYDTYAVVSGLKYHSTATEIYIADTYKGKPVTAIAGGFYHNDNIVSITLPDTVTSIYPKAIVDCKNLTSINLDNVTYVGQRVFSECPNFGEIENGVRYADKFVIGYVEGLTQANIRVGTIGIVGEAFDYCNSLRSISLPDTLTYIGGYAFSGCTGLTSITLPSSITSLEYAIFNDCINLTNIIYNGTIDQWNSIDKDSNIGWKFSFETINFTVTCTNGTLSKSEA